MALGEVNIEQPPGNLSIVVLFKRILRAQSLRERINMLDLITKLLLYNRLYQEKEKDEAQTGRNYLQKMYLYKSSYLNKADFFKKRCLIKD